MKKIYTCFIFRWDLPYQSDVSKEAEKRLRNAADIKRCGIEVMALCDNEIALRIPLDLTLRQVVELVNPLMASDQGRIIGIR